MHELLTDSAIWVALLGFAFYFIRKSWENGSVNRAILAETGRLFSVIKAHEEFWQNRVNDETTSHHQLIPFSHAVYDKQVKNVGVIRRNLVEKVVRFYGYVDYINDFQKLRKGYEEAGHTKEFNRTYLHMLGKLIATTSPDLH
jgi:hypothetical protein